MNHEPSTMAPWVQSRLGGRPAGRGVSKVLVMVGTHPRQLSYASTSAAAALAQVNVATVVRAAQLLGFSGWPALRSEVRSRYLAGLTAAEVLTEHSPSGDGLANATLRRDLQNLHDLTPLLDEAKVAEAATAIFAAKVTLVLGSGSFAAPGLQLAHLASTIGHDVRLHRTGGTALLNAVSLLGEGDAVVVFHVWRTPEEIFNAVRAAKAGGATIIMISDRAHQDLADKVVMMPSEGVGMFPSLVAATTLVQALIAYMVDLDADRAAAASDRVEELWRTYGLFPDPNA
ncbi:MurR/RpiR family transcriptional regulator [Segeticoccus rhizosphaerae]|uniref:MurR/RpiR family transcriptional regulator n=1 Tax=Segeticoccus rhizosphaerae TaxID=1104777 RepID=UPI0013905AE9|nr:MULTISPECIES: MurR/RpiR family transcriptional regulator [Intrasporangiaceae]